MTSQFLKVVALSKALRRYDQTQTAAQQARTTARKNGITLFWCAEDGANREAQDALIAAARSIAQA